MTGTRLRYLAAVNPPSQAFDRLSGTAEVTFMPLETVWADSRLDIRRRRVKADVRTGYVRFEVGDVLVPKVTPTFQAGRSALMLDLENGVGAGSTEIHVLRPHADVDGRYVAYATKSQPFLTEGVAAFQGVAGLQRVPEQFVRDFQLPIVTLADQRRIADFLDDQVARLDLALERLSLQQQLLAEREQAAVDGALDDLLDRNPVARFGWFVRGIEQGWSPQCDSVPAGDSEWGVVKVSAVKHGHFVEAENKRLPDGLLPQTHYEIRPGDVLVTRANTPKLVGDVAVVGGDVRPRLLLCDKIMRLQLDLSALRADFAALMLRSTRARQQLAAVSTGTSQSMVNIRGEDVRSMGLPLVSLATQDGLVQQIRMQSETTTRMAGLIVRHADLLTERKQALITAAVNGEFDVSTARGVA